MKNRKLISLKTTLNEFNKRTGITGNLDRQTYLGFAHFAADRVLTAEQLVHKIALLPVKNYKVDLPDDFKTIIQIGYRQTCDTSCNTRLQITEITQNILGSDCDLKINVECPSCQEYSCSCGHAIIEINADRLFEMNNPHLLNYTKHMYDHAGTSETDNVYRSVYHPEFVLIRRTSSSFFNTPYHISECLNINADCNIEYTIENGSLMLNVKDGEILCAYFARPTDEEGYLMIPDDPTVVRAITYSMIEQYLHMKSIESGGDRNFLTLWRENERLANTWIPRARMRLEMPDFDDFHAFITGFIHRVVPYYKYWENGNRRTGDTFKYPGETYNLTGNS
jgi:hypothetical protein